MITDERVSARGQPPPARLPRPLGICLCFDYISHRTVVSNDKSRDGNPMLSDMGRLGYVKIYLRLGVGGDSLGCVRHRKETPAGGRGSSSVRPLLSFRPASGRPPFKLLSVGHVGEARALERRTASRLAALTPDLA